MKIAGGRLRVFWSLSIDGWFVLLGFPFVLYFLTLVSKLTDMFIHIISPSFFPSGFIAFSL